MTKAKALSKHFGGIWHYCGQCVWQSDDGRSVCRVSNGVDEFDNPLYGPEMYSIFGNGEKCRRLFRWYEVQPT